ncbi:MAG: diaminopimelate epimerase [Nitrospinae bacterium]|nr:diaminopimelate epimerase [Nitrospinota bacterium]
MPTTVPFVKMHGAGNDFVMLDLRKMKLPQLKKKAAFLLDRRFGIGGDQIITIEPSKKADYRMRIFNADGSEVEMCGNGIRCFAKYLWDRKEKIIRKTGGLAVETLAGIIRPKMIDDNRVQVDMGEPILDGRAVPTTLDGQVVDRAVKIAGAEYRITAVSMGNPHAVIFTDDVDGTPLEKVGPPIETATDLFPKRINVEFVEVMSKSKVKARVWERGSGITLACGTGACAVAVASALNGKTGRKVAVHLPGGRLDIEWTKENRVLMTGPAAEVFAGTITL